ncbi:MAG: cysteine desulfurase [Anaerolineaceae bacterium]|nr:MAG: cysteine desulfurase [Anaerolineaceae bacterium]
MSNYDVDAIRADFPILHQEHSPGKPLIYLDNGASSQRPEAVIESMNDYYRRYHANVHRGIHKLSAEATDAYERVRGKVQRFINAEREQEIVFTRGTTEAVNLVMQTWGRQNIGAGDVIIATVMEHHANIVPWQMLAAEKGCTIRYLSVLDDGSLNMAQLDEWLATESVKLVTVIHTSNTLGTINPVAEITRKAHDSGALILVDAAQSVPHMPVDVQSLNIDFLVFSGHKMCGPTGVGVLYAKYDLLEAMPPFMGGGDMIERVTLEGSTWNEVPHKFEAGTPSIAEVIGLGAAVDYLEHIGMTSIHEHELQIVNYAYGQISQMDGVQVYGGADRGGLISFNINGLHAHDVAQILDSEGVAVRSGHHCTQPLHDALGISASARASFYLYNTREEVDVWLSAVEKARRVFAR